MEETRPQETKECSHEKFETISLSGVILELFMTFKTNN